MFRETNSLNIDFYNISLSKDHRRAVWAPPQFGQVILSSGQCLSHPYGGARSWHSPAPASSSVSGMGAAEPLVVSLGDTDRRKHARMKRFLVKSPYWSGPYASLKLRMGEVMKTMQDDIQGDFET